MCLRVVPQPGDSRPLRLALRNLRHDNAGVAAVEFGAVAAVLILMMICVIDFGLGFYRKMELQNAAQAGAQYAMKQGFIASGITSAVTSATALTDITVSPAPSQFCGCPSTTGVATATCTSTCTDGTTPGTYVAVSAQSTYTPVLSYPMLPRNFTLTAQSTVRIQ